MAIICFLFSVSLFAQNTPGGLIAEDTEPSVEINAHSDLEDPYTDKFTDNSTRLYEDLQVKKSLYTPIPATYKSSPIDRSYYINNPFEIEDLSNPFNLPKAGKKKIISENKKNLENVEKFFQTLFAYSATQDNSPINSKQPTPLWVLFLLLGNLTFFTYLLQAHRADIKKNLHSFLNPRSAIQQYREQKNSLSLSAVLSYLLFGWSMGSFIFLTNNLLFPEPNTASEWAIPSLTISIFGLLGLYLLKHLQLKVITLIFPFSQQVEYYNFLIANTNKLIGLFLTPLLFLCAYLPEEIRPAMIYMSLFVLGLIYLYRTGQGILSAGEIILFHKFHFFIYLCTVEIAPILILLKLLSII